MHQINHTIIEEYTDFLHAREFPCVAARAAIDKQQVKCLVVDHMACPKDDIEILHFLYDFIDNYRSSSEFFHSASVIFKEPTSINEDLFDVLLWQRLQALSNLDALKYGYDRRVAADPSSPQFSFSLKEEAFFIIGLHPASSRQGRRFNYPTLAFNPHAQFEQLRETNRYTKMKNIVRKRDIAFSGSINPMLEDYGESSEVYQYSGRVYDNKWQCPLKNNYEPIEDHSSS
ncbi:MAG: guanitoxin biosynthesis heme-dependent pre-guanitoxin N-hydroxylase GntA [Chitinophagaceae bacterium]